MDNGLETKVAFGDFMQAFEAFKEANDDRLGQIEQRMSADAVTSDKVERINRAVDETKARLDELALKARRPRLTGEQDTGPATREHKQAFETYVRKGETQGLFDLEAKSMSIGSNPDGGYLVPSETEAEIGRIRQLEQELGVPIVERGQRYIGLTPEGERVLKWAHLILDNWQSLQQELGTIRSQSGELAGRLVLGVIPSALPMVSARTPTTSRNQMDFGSSM